MNLSILLPIFNEAENIERVILEISEVLTRDQLEFEIIAVDDGSFDRTREILLNLRKKYACLTLVLFQRNFGKSASIGTALKESKGTTIVTMDADFQNNPSDILPMLTKLSNHDLVSGWRRKRNDPLVVKKLPSFVANWILRKITQSKIHDNGCALKVYRREVMEHLYFYGQNHRWVALSAELKGARVTEHEVHHRPRDRGYSKYGLLRIPIVTLDLMKIFYQSRYQERPFHFFGALGIFLLAFGILFEILMNRTFWVESTICRASSLGTFMTCVIGALGMFGLGLLFEDLRRNEPRNEINPQFYEVIKNGSSL